MYLSHLSSKFLLCGGWSRDIFHCWFQDKLVEEFSLKKIVLPTGGEESCPLLDGYIFSGLSDELKQKIIVVASGRQDVTERTGQSFSGEFGCSRLLSFSQWQMSDIIEYTHKIKLVNYLLASIHFIASIEAMFLAVRAGIHPSIIYDIVSNATGSARLFIRNWRCISLTIEGVNCQLSHVAYSCSSSQVYHKTHLQVWEQ